MTTRRAPRPSVHSPGQHLDGSCLCCMVNQQALLLGTGLCHCVRRGPGVSTPPTITTVPGLPVAPQAGCTPQLTEAGCAEHLHRRLRGRWEPISRPPRLRSASLRMCREGVPVQALDCSLLSRRTHERGWRQGPQVAGRPLPGMPWLVLGTLPASHLPCRARWTVSSLLEGQRQGDDAAGKCARHPSPLWPVALKGSFVLHFCSL